jgi:hypothetical protein
VRLLPFGDTTVRRVVSNAVQLLTLCRSVLDVIAIHEGTREVKTSSEKLHVSVYYAASCSVYITQHLA